MKNKDIGQRTIETPAQETTCDYCGLALYEGETIYTEGDSGEFCSPLCIKRLAEMVGNSEEEE